MDGGYGKVDPATEEVQQICNEVKTQAEAKAGQTFDQFQAISYRQQVVAGMNYLIKVCVGSTITSYVHLIVYQSLPNQGSTMKVTAIETGMKKSDPLEPFY